MAYLNSFSPYAMPQAATTTEQANPANQQGTFGDSVDAFQAGALSAVGGILDFVGAEGFAKNFYGWADDQYSQMSDAGRESMGKQIFTTDEEGNFAFGEGASDLDTWLLGFANMAGQFLPTAIPGAGAAGAITRVASLGAKGKAVANAAGMGAFGGAAGTGQGMEEARNEYMQIPDELKAESDLFKAAIRSVHKQNPEWTYDQKWDAADAMLAEQIANDVRTDPKVLLANFGASAIGDPVIGKALMGARIAKSGKLRSAIKGFAVEGSTEAAQAGITQYGINEALQPIDNRDAMKGVAVAAANEGILGGAFGGVAGGIGGAINRQPPVDPAVEKVRQSNPGLAAELDNLNISAANKSEQLNQLLNNQPATPATEQAAVQQQVPEVDYATQRRAELEQALQTLDTTQPNANQQVEEINRQLSQLESSRAFASVASLTASKPYRDAVKAGLPIEIVPAKYTFNGKTSEGFKWRQKAPAAQPAMQPAATPLAQMDAPVQADTGSILQPGNAPVVQADPAMQLPPEVNQALASTPAQASDNVTAQPEVTTNVTEENAGMGEAGIGSESNLLDRGGEANRIPVRDSGLQPQLSQPAAEPMASSTENTPVADAGGVSAPSLIESDQAAVTPSPETDTAPQAAQEAQARPAIEPVADADATAAQQDVTSPDNAEPAADLAGETIDPEWTAFADDTGTKKVPRAEMPQIKAEHRGALTQFMKGRGITHEQQTVPATELKPTQAEFSPGKVKKAMEFDGGNRSILVSSDGYVLDGHHQWLAAREKGEAVDVIRLDAPIEELIPLAKEFPSSTVADGATESNAQVDTPAPATKPTLRERKEAARKSNRPAESKAVSRATGIIGAKAGDTIRIDGNIGYADSGDYYVEQINNDGTVFISNDQGTTNLTVSDLVAAQRRGEVKFTKLASEKAEKKTAEKKPAEPAVQTEPDAITGEYAHTLHSDVTATVSKTDKGYSIDWGEGDVQQFTGKTAADKVQAALKREQYSKPDTDTRNSDVSFASGNYEAKRNQRAKGVPVPQVERMAQQFMKRINGGAGIKVVVLRDQKEAELAFNQSLSGSIVRGAYNDANKTAYLIADNFDDIEHARRTLAHEVIAHGGLQSVIGAKTYRDFLMRINATRTRASFRPAWNGIMRDYGNLTPEKQAEEFFARWVEDQPETGSLKYWWKALLRWLNEQLAKVGITRAENNDVAAMRDMLDSIVQGFKSGRAPRRQQGKAVAFDKVDTEADMDFSRTADQQPAGITDRIKSAVKPKNRFAPSRVPEWEALNAELRETDKTAASKLKRELSRWLMPGGNMPEVVKQAVRGRDRDVAVHEFDVSMLVGKLDEALKANGLNADKLTDEQWQKYHDFLTGQNDGSSLTDKERGALLLMRQQIDGLTRDYVASVTDKLQRRLEEDGTTDPAELARLEKMMGNIGKYLNRSYKAFDDPKWFSKIPTEVLDDAREYLINQYTASGMAPDQASNKANITLNEMVKTGTAYDSLGAFIAESKLGSKDLSVLIPRKDIAPEIRALLGEYKDPRINYAKSVAKMSSMIANDKLLNTIRDMGIGAFIFEKDNRPANATVQLAGDNSAVYAPLNGMWTTPEIKEAFEDAMGDKPGEGWLETAIKINGFIKYGKTVLSPTTAMRNVMSSYFFTVANGHFNQKYMKQAVAAFNAQVKGKVTDGESDYIKRLIKLGVLYDSANAGEMVRAMTDGRVVEMLEGKTGAVFDSLRWLNTKATGFYRFGDDFWKIVGFENEKAALIRAGMPEAEAEATAAERIQDTYPTYSRVGKAGVWLSRFPLVGTFVSFPAEIIRTTANMVKLAASEIKSDNPKIRAMGARRIVGMSLASGGMFALSALSAAMFGVTDDEEEALRNIGPEWQKNSTFVYAGRDEKGNLRYFDMTFLDPYGYWKRPIEALMRDQPVDKALASSLKDMLAPFFSVDITAGKLLEVISNQKESGGQVFKENDSAIRQAADISKHLALGLAPGAINNAWRIGMAAADQKRSTGQPYSLQDEMLALLGFRSSTFDPKVSLYYRTFDFNSSVAEARKELSGVLRDPNKVSDDDITAARERAARKQEKAFKDMAKLVNAAETGGATRTEIIQILRLAGISQTNVRYLLNGQVPPVNLSDRSFESAVKRAQLIMDADAAREVRSRFSRIVNPAD